MAKVSAVILIYDIRGFTAASKKLQSGELGAFATAAHRSILELFAARPPTFVKNLGDGHLLIWETTPEPDKVLVEFVVSTAARARAVFPAFVAGQLEQPEKQGLKLPTRVGIGVAVGEVSRSDDYYGVVVNLAARLQNMARPEGLALDQPTFGMAGKREELVKRGFRKARVSLKGLGTTLVWVDRPFSWERLLKSLWPLYVAILAPIAYVLFADASSYAFRDKEIRAWLDRHELSVFRRAKSAAVVRATAEQDRRQIADALIKGRLANGLIALDLSRPDAAESDFWSTSQAILCLLAQPHLDQRTLRDWLQVYDNVAFKTGVFIPGYGWPPHAGETYTQAEATLWTVAALARALGKPGLLEPEAVPRFEGYLRQAQEAAMRYRPLETGGWNTYPNQSNLTRYSPYSTTLALLALLETRAAGKPWRDSIEERDQLLAQTAQFLIQLYEEKGGLRGWRRTADAGDPISEGLTLQIYFELLWAEKEAGIQLPAGLLSEIPRHLDRLKDRTGESASDAGEYRLTFKNHQDVVQSGGEAINFLWHPWAIATAVRWLDRAARIPPPTEDLVRVRRILGYLVVNLSKDKLKEIQANNSFVAAETLYGLAQIPEK